MKKLLVLFLSLSLLLTNCEFLRKKGILGSDKELKAQLEQLQDALKKDSLKFAAVLDKMKMASQQKIDSIQKCCGKVSGNYHVITGSFQNPGNADGFVKEMEKQGYKAQIVQASNGFNLVSTFASDDFHTACSALNTARTNVNPESWLYIAK